ncbi:hypothetical protein [Bacillus pumilus]|uniref:hypothetical protein n=1 Tax=Bacillus pumilus TaxID=1408 RepID=UPI001CB9A175|nr:hypothetical protein [Bacillus pumilus]
MKYRILFSIYALSHSAFNIGNAGGAALGGLAIENTFTACFVICCSCDIYWSYHYDYELSVR